ncbi:hypothetical protein CEXT_610931 [Caerostris extrusa]|uniref:Uncharacterized protein n=1 Tax=Caerostris extrusa TaxID=172846 RepID=A0AAV4NN34_CAEEX|nr:hypothetical protein CEXT_610931 [Caerostris extrusa]
MPNYDEDKIFNESNSVESNSIIKPEYEFLLDTNGDDWRKCMRVQEIVVWTLKWAAFRLKNDRKKVTSVEKWILSTSGTRNGAWRGASNR